MEWNSDFKELEMFKNNIFGKIAEDKISFKAVY